MIKHFGTIIISALALSSCASTTSSAIKAPQTKLQSTTSFKEPTVEKQTSALPGTTLETTTSNSKVTTTTTQIPTTSTTIKQQESSNIKLVENTQSSLAEVKDEVIQAQVADPVSRTTETNSEIYSQIGDIELFYPSAKIELIGFHQSNHEGAQAQTKQNELVKTVTLESRSRLTAMNSAADIVIPPGEEIIAPVTGTVKRAGTYTLYCKHTDSYAVIEPDTQPGFEVKLLHITGLQIQTGDRVEAGQTVIASGPTQLPFESQVDKHTSQPSWPHVHLEVIDLSIPDIPSPGGGC